MTASKLNGFRCFAEGLARHAGSMAICALQSDLEVSFKAGDEIVTETDKAIEQYLRDEILAAYPDHEVIGEEAGRSGDESAEWSWYLDPIDGTRNFAAGIPYFNISIGLMRDMKPVMGVVYDPLHDDLFTAHLGGGAFCNDKAIRISTASNMNDSMIIVDYHRSKLADYSADFIYGLFRNTGKVRMLGAVALDLCLVACGRCDGLLALGSSQLKLMDLVAACCILGEAGGVCFDLTGSEFSWSSTTLIAGGQELVNDMIKQLPVN